MKFGEFDSYLIARMRIWGIPLLRISLGIVFLWFGALKIFGVSPVADLISQTYSFFPTHAFMLALGVWEVLIGIGLISNIALRTTLFLLWLQMAGTFAAFVMNPELFFQHGNPLILTTEGEFVIKNLVLVSAGIAVGGHSLEPSPKSVVS